MALQKQSYLTAHGSHVEYTSQRCNQCLNSNGLLHKPFDLCTLCLDKFIKNNVVMKNLSVDVDEKCAFCLRLWDTMPQNDLSEFSTPEGKSICEKCERYMLWTHNICVRCDKRVDMFEDYINIELPNMSVCICNQCAIKASNGMLLTKHKDNCLWCSESGEIKVGAIGRACNGHAQQKLLPKKFAFILK